MARTGTSFLARGAWRDRVTLPAAVRAVSIAAIVIVAGLLAVPSRTACGQIPTEVQTRGRIGQGTSPGQIIVRLPSPQGTVGGDLIVQPNVELRDWQAVGPGEVMPRSGPVERQGRITRPSEQLLSQPMLPAWEDLGPGMKPPSGYLLPTLPPPIQVEEVEAMPIFEGMIEHLPAVGPPSFGALPVFHQDPFEGPRVGHERLPFALFEMEPAQPFANFRIRTAVAGRHEFPDRAEYFWARTVDGRGPPLPERTVDYQELRFRLELGGSLFSTAIDVPFRMVNPEVNQNHAGLSDLQLATKLVLLNGVAWQITQYTGFHFPTGAPRAGLGTGHVSMEPGFLFRYKFSDDTWFHGQTMFWFPLGGHPLHAGEVLSFAAGVNHVWWETDYVALIPSLEFMTYSVLRGLKRNEFGVNLPVDGDLIFNIVPGIHLALGRGGDLGLFEFGVSGAIATTPDRFHDFKLNFDLRWSF